MESSKKSSIEIRQWNHSDRAEMIPMLIEYIRLACPDMVPSEANAEYIFQLASNATPCLIAFVDGTSVGFTATSVIPFINTKDRILQSLGTFVKDEFRNMRIATLLRHKAISIAKGLEFDRIQGVMYKEELMPPMEHLGARRVGYIYEYNLKEL